MDTLKPEQTLTETWQVKFERQKHFGDHYCHIYMIHPVIISSSGHGKTIGEARIDALIKTAAGYIDDDDADWQVSDETLDLMVKAVNTETLRRSKLKTKKATK